jgi:intraflagellar transport protein 140
MEPEPRSVLEQLEAAYQDSSAAELPHLIKLVNQCSSGEDALAFELLAKIAVKKRDIETGLYCVSRMKMGRVCRDVRSELTSSNGSFSALALLAINLKIPEEAEAILIESNDRVALSNFYQETNEWRKAIDCIDRLNLKNVYYKYAKHLEAEGKFQEAIKYYEKSNTHTFEVPRMLFDLDDANHSLYKYCTSGPRASSPSSSDTDAASGTRSELMRWWAQYSESIGNNSEALNWYEKAGDYYNFVRLLCFSGETEKAKSVLAEDEAENANPDLKRQRNAGRLFLAKQLEQNRPAEAVDLYIACNAIRQALRVCRTNDMLNDLVKITVNYGSSNDAADLIRQLADKSRINADSLVRLYQKSGETGKAIEIAIEHRSWLQLREIVTQELEQVGSSGSTSITEESVHQVLAALRDDAEIIDIVIDLLLLTKSDRISLIEQLLTEFNVQIHEELIEKIEKITQNRGENATLTTSLAEMALRQGRYVMAAKLFNSVGDRVASLKALIREGNTEKIISYANIARDKAVFKIAANFLQTVSFQDKSVISNFYRKAGAREELERFQASH